MNEKQKGREKGLTENIALAYHIFIYFDYIRFLFFFFFGEYFSLE
jgi:hypothetical protein